MMIDYLWEREWLGKGMIEFFGGIEIGLIWMMVIEMYIYVKKILSCIIMILVFYFM